MDDINIITGVIGAVISVITMIAKISNGECLPKKEWILTERFSLFKRIYLFFKPLIDMVVPIVLFAIVATILCAAGVNSVISMSINIALIVVLQVLAYCEMNTEDYIYNKIKNNKARVIINIIYYVPAVALTVSMWMTYIGKSKISEVFIYMFLLSCLSYFTYLEPVNKKMNKYVDIFTDTRKSYLNIECKNISQKGQWYFIKEGDATRKIMKERVSEFVCHD